MGKVRTQDTSKFYHNYPRLAVIVTAHAGDRDNAMAAAWHSPLSLKPPLYGVSISPKRFTYRLIQQSKQFGVNFLPFEAAELIASVGGSNGAEIDKFQRFNISVEKPLKTAVPILKEAYASYECKLIDHKTYGDHEWLVGEIVAVHFLEEAFTPEQVLDVARLTPALYLGADQYLTVTKETVLRLDREFYGKR